MRPSTLVQAWRRPALYRSSKLQPPWRVARPPGWLRCSDGAERSGFSFVQAFRFQSPPATMNACAGHAKVAELVDALDLGSFPVSYYSMT